jgi:hypothetical protein
MSNRRTFLKQTAVLAAGVAGVPSAKAAPPTSNPSSLAVEKDTPGGAPANRVPDTLELAEHGRLALNGMLGTLDPAVDYECAFLTLFDVHPAYMLHWSSMVSGVMPKYLEALPLLRLMSGSREGMELQDGLMGALLKNTADDGLVYDRTREDRPWNTGVGYGVKDWDEDYANMAGNGRLLAGLTYWHQWTAEPKWKERAKKTAERMLQLAVVRDNIAYYPNPGLGNDFSYPRTSGWTKTAPPEKANEGFEGATLFYLFQPLRGFVRYYTLSGDERFLELSRKFVNLGVQAKFWGADRDMHPALGAQRGHFKGHFHGNLAAVRGLLDYALVAGDSRLALLVRDAYDWARQQGIHCLGLFPTWNGTTEGCTIADMTGLAVALSDAGLGDYWDDVEQYVRNGLISAQATDKDEMIRVSEAGKARPKDSPWGGRYDWRFSGNNKGVLKGQEITDRVIVRNIGAFGHLLQGRSLVPMLMHCCTANCAQALYYAWEAIIRSRNDSAEVNLWLNRRSPWCDVWSWLPYAGKLVVQNKGMRRLAIRKPGWARQSTIRCWLDGREVQPVWLGNRILLDDLKGQEQIRLEVPLSVEKAEYGLVDLNQRGKLLDSYACEFKGHTAIGVGTGQDTSWYRLFRREDMRRGEAQMKPLPEYVHPAKLVQWMVL